MHLKDTSIEIYTDKHLKKYIVKHLPYTYNAVYLAISCVGYLIFAWDKLFTIKNEVKCFIAILNCNLNNLLFITEDLKIAYDFSYYIISNVRFNL